jgi:hypothetical protein
MLLKAPFQKFGPVAAAISLGVLSQPTFSSEIALVGPIERVDCKASTLQILGVRLFASDAKSARLICSLQVSSGTRLVSAQGLTDGANVVQLKSLQLLAKSAYVAGATNVYVRGYVSEVSLTLGVASISGAIFDSSYALPTAGSLVEVAGTQPVLGGTIVPLLVNILSQPVQTDSSIGSGANANSSIGSGVSFNSSIGSGVDANSSIGSGVSLNSSIGSGVVANSSIGSGVSLNSSIGSGVVANSSIGSGVALNSSIGSGVVANSSIGSGVSLNSSIGSGVSRNSSIGSGLQ